MAVNDDVNPRPEGVAREGVRALDPSRLARPDARDGLLHRHAERMMDVHLEGAKTFRFSEERLDAVAPGARVEVVAARTMRIEWDRLAEGAAEELRDGLTQN